MSGDGAGNGAGGERSGGGGYAEGSERLFSQAEVDFSEPWLYGANATLKEQRQLLFTIQDTITHNQHNR